MRVFIVGAVFLITTSAAAQSRWTFSAGPEWVSVSPTASNWGARIRAEYDLFKPDRMFGLRLEGAARWGPTQSYFYSANGYSSGGNEQRTDLMLGLAGSFAPFASAPLTPYLSAGIYGRQQWTSGFRSYLDPFTPYTVGPAYPPSHGDITAALGLGLRARFGGRTFQLEFRGFYDSNSVTFGTRLPF